jgi:hypothetical protein
VRVAPFLVSNRSGLMAVPNSDRRRGFAMVDDDDWLSLEPRRPRPPDGDDASFILTGLLLVGTALAIGFMRIVPLGTAGCSPNCGYGLLFGVDRVFPIVAVAVFVAASGWSIRLRRQGRRATCAPLLGLAVLAVAFIASYLLEVVAMTP